MNKSHRHFFIQSFLVCSLLLLYLATNNILTTQAEACVRPQAMHGNDNAFDSWQAVTEVNVRISDAWSTADRGYIQEGIDKWNPHPLYPNCSFVKFVGFEAYTVTDPSASPPDNTAS